MGLGIADDLQDADAVSILTFKQAQDAARAWWKDELRREQGLGEEPSGPYKINAAIEGYIADYQRRGGKDIVNTRSMPRTRSCLRSGPSKRQS